MQRQAGTIRSPLMPQAVPSIMGKMIRCNLDDRGGDGISP